MNNTMFAQTFRTKYLEQMKKSSKTRLDYKTLMFCRSLISGRQTRY